MPTNMSNYFMTDNSQIFPPGFLLGTGPTITEQVAHDGATESYIIDLTTDTWGIQSKVYFARHGTHPTGPLQGLSGVRAWDGTDDTLLIQLLYHPTSEGTQPPRLLVVPRIHLWRNFVMLIGALTSSLLGALLRDAFIEGPPPAYPTGCDQLPPSHLKGVS